MKPISIHPFSVLAGVALLGAVMITSGALQATLIHKAPCPDDHTEFVVGPDLSDMVVVREGSPFVVPIGKWLTITAMGWSLHPLPRATPSGIVILNVDGSVIGPSVSYQHGSAPFDWELYHPINTTTSSVVPVPRWVVRGGSSVEVTDFTDPGSCRAWGFLRPVAGSCSVERVMVQGLPDPADFISFYNPAGSQFVVPAGKVFMPVGLIGGQLKIDGVPELEAWSAVSSQAQSVPLGLSAKGGSLVEIQAFAWGYLVDS